MSIDAVAVATSAGHGAAVNLVLGVAGGALGAGLDAECWPSFCVPRLANEDRDVVGELGAYVAKRVEATAGETLFRKACELGVTGAAADGWPGLAAEIQLAYELFADVTFRVARRIEREAAALAPRAPAPPPPKLEDTIFEELDGLGAMDADRVAALKAAATTDMQDRAIVGGPDTPIAMDLSQVEPGASGAPPAEAPLSIGESVAAPRPRKHGGKRTKGETTTA